MFLYLLKLDKKYWWNKIARLNLHRIHVSIVEKQDIHHMLS